MKTISQRGSRWFDALTAGVTPLPTACPSIRAADSRLGDKTARYLAVVPDPANHYPRARCGEVGLLEGWTLAQVINETVESEAGKAEKSAVISIIDVPSQAYGRREEAFGIHQALAAAVAAYARARLAGHPLIGLIVGKAMSGAFLAHGYQSSRLIAFTDPEVQVHAMGKASAARITLRSIEALEELVTAVPPMAYDIHNFASLGILSDRLDIADPEHPGGSDMAQVEAALVNAINDAIKDNSLKRRLGGANRQHSVHVRERMRQAWHALS